MTPISGIEQRRVLTTEIPGPRSAALQARKKAAVSAGVSTGLPVYVERAGGGILVDVDGNQLIDFGSGIAVTTVGNAAPRVVERVQAQAADFTHTWVPWTIGSRMARPARRGSRRWPRRPETWLRWRWVPGPTGREAVPNRPRRWRPGRATPPAPRSSPPPRPWAAPSFPAWSVSRSRTAPWRATELRRDQAIRWLTRRRWRPLVPGWCHSTRRPEPWPGPGPAGRPPAVPTEPPRRSQARAYRSQHRPQPGTPQRPAAPPAEELVQRSGDFPSLPPPTLRLEPSSIGGVGPTQPAPGGEVSRTPY